MTHTPTTKIQKKKVTYLKQRLYVDMDGTLTEFKKHQPIENLYKEGYFQTLKPHKNVVIAINIIIDTRPDIQVIPLSGVLTDSFYAESEKYWWLSKHTPKIEQPIFVPAGHIKSDYIMNITKSDILLDDLTKNLQEWQGTSIKLINDINDTNKTWTGFRVYYNDSPEKIAKDILLIMAMTKQVRKEA